MSVNKDKEAVIREQLKSAQRKIDEIVDSFSHSAGRFADSEINKMIDSIDDNLEIVKLLLEKSKK
jgi:hypothetical protein